MIISYYYDGDTLTAVPFEVLASLIRMGHKYALQDILDHALSRLKKYYTDDLAGWKDPASRERYVTATDDDALTAVALARLTNTPSLLPTALLICMKIATDYWEDADGAVVPRIAALPVSDQLQLTAAKASLTEACATRPLRLLADSVRGLRSSGVLPRATRGAAGSAARPRRSPSIQRQGRAGADRGAVLGGRALGEALCGVPGRPEGGRRD